MSALRRALNAPGRLISAALAPISPPDGERAGEFAMSMVLCNLMSIIALTLWCLGVVATDDEILLETGIFLVKWLCEIEYGDFKADSWDLLAHHVLYLSALGVAKLIDSPSEQEAGMSIIISLTSIHIPLLFRWVRRVAQMWRWPRTASAADTAFLVIWPLTVAFRGWVSTRVFWPRSHPNFVWLEARRSRFMLLPVLPLDLLWTPWRRWRECLLGKRPSSRPTPGSAADHDKVS